MGRRAAGVSRIAPQVDAFEARRARVSLDVADKGFGKAVARLGRATTRRSRSDYIRDGRTKLPADAGAGPARGALAVARRELPEHRRTKKNRFSKRYLKHFQKK